MNIRTFTIHPWRPTCNSIPHRDKTSFDTLQNIGHMHVPQDSKSLTGGQVVMAKAGTMHKDLQLNACPKSCELYSMDARILRSMSLEHSTRSYAVHALTLGTIEDAERPPPIPGVEQARHIIEQELLRQRPQAHAAPVAKRLLHIAINATITTAAVSMLQSNTTRTHSPSPPSLQLCIRLPPWSASISRTTRPRTGSTALHATATSSTLRALRLHTYLTL